MKIEVLLASGDVDEWDNAVDAVDDRGALVVLGGIEGEEVPGDLKTMVVKTQVPQDCPIPEGELHVCEHFMEKSETFAVVCVYAPGMWMKVEYNT